MSTIAQKLREKNVKVEEENRANRIKISELENDSYWFITKELQESDQYATKSILVEMVKLDDKLRVTDDVKSCYLSADIYRNKKQVCKVTGNQSILCFIEMRKSDRSADNKYAFYSLLNMNDAKSAGFNLEVKTITKKGKKIIVDDESDDDEEVVPVKTISKKGK